jgi:mannose-6-phosphate isomerase-like protein (cupin superfamily)
MIRRSQDDFTWNGVDVLPYKEDGRLFKSVTRQVLFEGEGDLNVQFRYFEVGPGGHSTLEKHLHQHAVMIIRGGGHVLVGEDIGEVGLQDVVHIPPLTWHQFRATGDQPLGFLCVVANDRDRPLRASDEDVAEFPEHVRNFVRY